MAPKQGALTKKYMPPERKDNNSKFLLLIPLIKFFWESGVLNVDLECFFSQYASKICHKPRKAVSKIVTEVKISWISGIILISRSIFIPISICIVKIPVEKPKVILSISFLPPCC